MCYQAPKSHFDSLGLQLPLTVSHGGCVGLPAGKSPYDCCTLLVRISTEPSMTVTGPIPV